MSLQLTGCVLDAEVIVQWLTGSGPWLDRLRWIRQEYVEGRCGLVLPDVALLDIVAALHRVPNIRPAEVAMALSLLKDMKLSLKPLTIEAAARAEALMRLSNVSMTQGIYMALAEQMGWPWLMAEVPEAAKQWGMAVSLQDLPGIANESPVQVLAQNGR